MLNMTATKIAGYAIGAVLGTTFAIGGIALATPDSPIGVSTGVAAEGAPSLTGIDTSGGTSTGGGTGANTGTGGGQAGRPGQPGTIQPGDTPPGDTPPGATPPGPGQPPTPPGGGKPVVGPAPFDGPLVVDPGTEPVVRDHRNPNPYGGATVRDHRGEGSGPIIRDHRTPGPTFPGGN